MPRATTTTVSIVVRRRTQCRGAWSIVGRIIAALLGVVAGRAAAQPFFMQVMLPGGKLRDVDTAGADALAARTFGAAVRPEDVNLPPYLPRDPVLLADRAAYLDAVRLTDHHVGRVLARLEAEGVLDDTLVIFMADHGISHARAKQFLYDEGTHIPFIVRGPGGRPREAVFAARDRCDETVDRIRSVRTDRFPFIRNFHPGHAADLEYRRGLLDRWMRETGDPPPETEAEYDSDMAVYVGAGNPEVERNIATMKRLAAEETAMPAAAPR